MYFVAYIQRRIFIVCSMETFKDRVIKYFANLKNSLYIYFYFTALTFLK